MELNKEVVHKCGLLIGWNGNYNKCLGGISHSPCCYYCNFKTTCSNVCFNHPKKCEEHHEFKKQLTKRGQKSKLDVKQAMEMLEEYRQGISQHKLAEKYHVSKTTIYRKVREMEICLGEMEE